MKHVSFIYSGGAGARTAYAKELMQHMDVDSFGRCLHNKDFPPEMQFPIYSGIADKP